MTQEIVKYENQFNNIALKDFTPVELDLLMSIVSRMREKEEQSVTFSFKQLEDYIEAGKNYSTEEFVEKLKNINRNLLQLNFEFVTDNRIIQFTLFSTFTIDLSSQELTIGVNPTFHFLLNNLNSNFTVFELQEFLCIRSVYAKECYRRLKQYRMTGYWKVTIENFRRLLNVPKSYSTGKVKERVLNIIERELSPYFEDFTIERVYAQTRGNPLTHLIFRFKSQDVRKLSQPQDLLDDSAIEAILSTYSETLGKLYSPEEIETLLTMSSKVLEERKSDLTPLEYLHAQTIYSQPRATTDLFRYTKKAVLEDYANLLT